jgi:hypothetical protein
MSRPFGRHEGKKMDEREFKRLALLVETVRGDYSEGYSRGLRRRYHGERFGTAEQHEIYMRLGLNGDEHRADLGRGYRDAFAGKLPEWAREQMGT